MNAEKQTGHIGPRALQLICGILIGIGFTAVGSFLWHSNVGSGESLVSRILGYVLLIFLGPGMFVSVLVNGVDDISLTVAQIANVVIYTALSYVFLRFLEWRRIKSPSK